MGLIIQFLTYTIMSNYQLTPKELGEIEIQEAILNALKQTKLSVAERVVLQIVKHVFYAVSLNDKFCMKEFCSLLEKVYERNIHLWMCNADLEGFAKAFANELIVCEFITEQTLEELGQKQLNEAY